MAQEGKPEGNGRRPAAGRGDEESRPPRKPFYRRKRVLIPIGVLVVAIAAGVWYYLRVTSGYVSTDDAYLDADRVEISAKVLGRIVELTADEGSHVAAGEVLARLDEADLKSQVDQARAGLELAKTSLPLAKVGLDRASDDFARAEVQFKGSVITREQFVHARQALEAAQAEYGVALSKVEVAKAQLGVVQTQLANMTLSAPFDGIVAKRWLIVGDVAAPGQPILTIYRTDLVWVTANLEETKLARVKLGAPVEVSIDTYAGRGFKGTVGLIGHYTASQFSLIPPNNASGNFTKVTQRVPLRVYFEGLTPEVRKEYPMRPGMSAEIKIRVE
jgi:membrane fusion protein (multidrug efflux system)